MTIQLRKPIELVTATEHEEGAGFIVQQPIPTHGHVQWDPILLIHEMGPTEHRAGTAKGAPDHPHRGFETVTYLLSGEMEHRDSAGNRGVLREGDVQWMTAGAGVVHSEMPSVAFQERGGRMHGFQIWVNLAAKDKLTLPRYQDTRSADLPVVEFEGGRVKVAAGDFKGQRSPIQTGVPSLFLDVQLKAGAEFHDAIPNGWNALAYVFEGSAAFGDQEVGGEMTAEKRQMILFGTQGEIKARAGGNGARFLILAGQPLNEPLARFGPFVMNTRKELEQAFWDYQTGKMGKI